MKTCQSWRNIIKRGPTIFFLKNNLCTSHRGIHSVRRYSTVAKSRSYIAHTRTVRGCFKHKRSRLWKIRKFDPATAPPSNDRSLNLEVWLFHGYMSVYHIDHSWISTPRMRDFAPPLFTRLFFRFLGGILRGLQPRPLNGFWRTALRQMRFRAGMCLFGVQKQHSIYSPLFRDRPLFVDRLWLNLIFFLVVFNGAKFKTLCQKPLLSTCACQLYRALGLDHPYISSWKVICIPNLETTS